MSFALTIKAMCLARSEGGWRLINYVDHALVYLRYYSRSSILLKDLFNAAFLTCW